MSWAAVITCAVVVSVGAAGCGRQAMDTPAHAETAPEVERRCLEDQELTVPDVSFGKEVRGAELVRVVAPATDPAFFVGIYRARDRQTAQRLALAHDGQLVRRIFLTAPGPIPEPITHAVRRCFAA